MSDSLDLLRDAKRTLQASTKAYNRAAEVQKRARLSLDKAAKAQDSASRAYDAARLSALETHPEAFRV